MGLGEYYYYAVISSTNGAEAVASDVSKLIVRLPSSDATLYSVGVRISTTTYEGTPHPTEPFAFDVALPYGTNLNNIAATAFVIAANDPGATIGTLVKYDSGARWEIPVTAEDGVTTATYTAYITAPFVPVESISGIPSNIAVGTDLRLIETFFGSVTYSLANINPANASNRTIVWSVSDPTNANIVTTSGGFFVIITSLHLESAATPGTEIELIATITNGAAPGTNYTQTFTLTVVNPLKDLIPSTGTLNPSFDPDTTDYTLSVPNSVTTFNVTPVLEDEINAAITVNGENVTSGQNSSDVDLSVGENPISVVVTAESGGTPKTYTITVTRLPYDFVGFLPPLDPDHTSSHMLGRAIPVKFQLVDIQGNYYADATARVYIAKVTNGVVGVEMEAESPGNSGNICDYIVNRNLYRFNLKTTDLTSGTYRIRVDLGDGLTYAVFVQFR
jgi:hypothetical protein